MNRLLGPGCGTDSYWPRFDQATAPYQHPTYSDTAGCPPASAPEIGRRRKGDRRPYFDMLSRLGAAIAKAHARVAKRKADLFTDTFSG